jgi:hypothetical protein
MIRVPGGGEQKVGKDRLSNAGDGIHKSLFCLAIRWSFPGGVKTVSKEVTAATSEEAVSLSYPLRLQKGSTT